jgi:pimeloyl-ACP methyl ester carboxylesterase
VSAPVQTRTATVAGVRSPVLCAGPEDATEVVVFVHGNPGPPDDWRPLVGKVGEFARALAPAMPGYGDADKPADFDYTITGYARHLDGVLRELGVQRAHLVLHDFGGPWGLTWAAANPDAFASVALINTGVSLNFKWHRLARIWRTPVLGELAMLTTTRGGVRVLAGRENPRLGPEALDRLYEIYRPWGTKRAVLKLLRATPPEAMAAPHAAMRELDRPTLVLWGTTDAYTSWRGAERQRESFPSARIELLEGLGHWPFLEDPGRVNESLLPFLREQLGGATPAA